MVSENCVLKLRVEATHVVANLIAEAPEGVLDRVLEERTKLLPNLLSALQRYKTNADLVMALIKSVETLADLADRNLFI